MKAYELIVGRTKDTFLYPVTENVYQNLCDVMDGIIIAEHEFTELACLLVSLTEVKGVAMVAADHVADSDMEWEFTVYTGTDFSDERELIEIKAVYFDEDMHGESLIGDITEGLANCNLLPVARRRRLKFLRLLSDKERVWTEILDAYLSDASENEEGEANGPSLLQEYKTSAEIVDEVSEMGVVDLDFVTRYMSANGYRPVRRPADGIVGWKIFKPIL